MILIGLCGRCKAACTKGKSIPERLIDFLKVIPEAAELQIISYKLSEIESKLKVYVKHKAGREGKRKCRA